jgi:MFS transporter, DHA2 family, multidrug resistance protein
VTAAGQGGVNPWAVAFAVSLATFMEVLDTTIVNVSLSHIAGTLGAGQEESTWVLTSYLVANGIVLPLSGWLAGVFGRRNYFLLCIAGFTAASFACGAATSLGMLVVFRLVQGIAGGGLQPTQQAIIIDTFPPEKRGTAFALTGITIIVAPVLGPTLGGWITDNFDWRWIFFMNLPAGALAYFLVRKLVKDPPHASKKHVNSIDYIGLSLIALGLGCLQIVLDKGQQEDWFHSNFILLMLMLLLAAAALVGAVAWLLTREEPIVDLGLLRDRSFAVCCALIFFTGFTLYSSSMLLPLLVQTQFGYDATLSGMVLSPGALCLLFVMPLAGKLVGKVDPRYLIAFGLLASGVGMWHTMAFAPDTDFSTFVVMRMLQVAGLPFLFIPVSATAFANIPKEKSGKASALYSLSRNLGGSIGIALVATYVARHTQMHHADLAAHVSAGTPAYEGYLSQYTRGAGNMLEGIGMAHARLWQELKRQAGFLAYRDGFQFLGVLMLSGLGLVALLPRVRKPKAAAVAESMH